MFTFGVGGGGGQGLEEGKTTRVLVTFCIQIWVMLHGGVFSVKIQCDGRLSLLSIEEKSIANSMAVGPVELPCVLY